MAANVAVGAVLFSSVALTLLLNGVIIANFTKRRRLRARTTIASNILYVYLAIIDIIGTLLWSAPAAYSAIRNKGEIWDLDCYFRLRVRVFCNVANALVLMILMTERLLRIFKPSKREDVHIKKSAVSVCLGISLACLIITCTTSWPNSFLQDLYFDDYFQCEYATEEGASYFALLVAVFICAPLVFIAIAYLAILIQARRLLSKRGPGDYAVLKGKREHSGIGYFFRAKTQSDLLKDVGSKTENPQVKLNKMYKDDGYHEPDVLDSSDEEFDADKEPNSYDICLLTRIDMKRAHAYAAISLVYFGLWIPYYIRMFMYTFYDASFGDVFVLVAVCLIHFGGIVKMPLYLISDTFRAAMMKTFGFR